MRERRLQLVLHKRSLQPARDLSKLQMYQLSMQKLRDLLELRGQFISPVRFLFLPGRCLRPVLQRDVVDATASCWKKKVMLLQLTAHYPQSKLP